MPATCPYPEPDKSSPFSHPNSWSSFLISSSYLGLGLPCGLFTSAFHTKTLYASLLSPTSATCQVHLIRLNFNTRMIFGREFRTLSSSFCSFLHSHYRLILLDLNIPLTTKFSNTLSLSSSLNDRPSFTPPQNNGQNYIYVYLYTCILG
jgi:hypothetical protein